MSTRLLQTTLERNFASGCPENRLFCATRASYDGQATHFRFAEFEIVGWLAAAVCEVIPVPTGE